MPPRAWCIPITAAILRQFPATNSETEAWATGFTDARITNPEYIDAGDIVIAQFTAEGSNDGTFGGLKPTGRRMSLPFCEICQFDKQGRIVSGGCYYDQYTLLTQLGHVQPLAVAA